jgi:hypothetical protein
MQGEYQHRFQQAESQCTFKTINAFSCLINHQLKLVVNKEIGNIN